MTDIRGLAVQSIALAELGKRVKERADRVKRELAEALDPGDRKTAALDDGTVVGSISYVKGRKSARVSNEAALTAWVAANHPDEIVQQIRPAYRAALLELAKTNGVAADPTTGEIVPGIEFDVTDPYLSAKPDPAGLPALIDAMRAGQLLALDEGSSE